MWLYQSPNSSEEYRSTEYRRSEYRRVQKVAQVDIWVLSLFEPSQIIPHTSPDHQTPSCDFAQGSSSHHQSTPLSLEKSSLPYCLHSYIFRSCADMLVSFLFCAVRSSVKRALPRHANLQPRKSLSVSVTNAMMNSPSEPLYHIFSFCACQLRLVARV